MSDRPTPDSDRLEQIMYLVRKLKIPRREADRMLANVEAGDRGDSA
jgi:hypothetical protein